MGGGALPVYMYSRLWVRQPNAIAGFIPQSGLRIRPLYTSQSTSVSATKKPTTSAFCCFFFFFSLLIRNSCDLLIRPADFFSPTLQDSIHIFLLLSYYSDRPINNFYIFSEGTEEETKAQALFQAYIFQKNFLI
jgi:hypothetical protein